MHIPKLNSTIFLTDKASLNELAAVSFNRLKTYFIVASDKNCIINSEDLSIFVNNNIISPPTRVLFKTLPLGKEFFPFDFSVKICNSNILKIELTFGFFWTLIYYLLMLGGCFVLFFAANYGRHNGSSFGLWFFSILITLYTFLISMVRVLALKRKIEEILD